MNRLTVKKYNDDLKEYAKDDINWDNLRGKVILLSGATGLIGTYFVDLIMYKNIQDDLKCKIIIICRNKDAAQKKFSVYLSNPYLEMLVSDVNNPIEYEGKINYIIHCASNTHPVQYATAPIETIQTNVFGTYHLLTLGSKCNIEKFILLSSFEVYGKVEHTNRIKENDYGVIDPLILRSCYPESKRLSENFCIAFLEEKHIPVNIVRLSRVFGPTMQLNSELATAQFMKCALANEDIVLKSNGEQLYSYNYVGDAVLAILQVLLKGENGQAYNVSANQFDCKLAHFAHMVANYVGKKVIFDLPNETEKKGFSNSVMTVLNSEKLEKLGYVAHHDIKYRIEETLDILKEMNLQRK